MYAILNFFSISSANSSERYIPPLTGAHLHGPPTMRSSLIRQSLKHWKEVALGPDCPHCELTPTNLEHLSQLPSWTGPTGAHLLYYYAPASGNGLQLPPTPALPLATHIEPMDKIWSSIVQGDHSRSRLTLFQKSIRYLTFYLTQPILTKLLPNIYALLCYRTKSCLSRTSMSPAIQNTLNQTLFTISNQVLEFFLFDSCPILWFYIILPYFPIFRVSTCPNHLNLSYSVYLQMLNLFCVFQYIHSYTTESWLVILSIDLKLSISYSLIRLAYFGRVYI